MKKLLLALLFATSMHAEPVPDKLVVLTFDDSVASQANYVAPLLKKHGLGATFFITEGFEFLIDKKNYMTWEQIKALHDQGFEIGNHTRKHAGVTKQKPEQLAADVEFIETRCAEHGIPKPESTLEQFKAAVAQAKDGKIAVMTFHGVPDIKHPWVNTDPAKFESYMQHLKDEGCTVIAMRDLVKYLPAK